MRVVVVSDMHGQFPRIPPCDILIVSGDVAPDYDPIFGGRNALRQIEWLRYEFTQWTRDIQAEEVVVTAGNHDFGLYGHRNMLRDIEGWHLLIDDQVRLFGLNIYGSPWVTGLPGWAFNLTEDQAQHRWSRIPEDIDILVLHGPPYGIGDTVRHPSGRHPHVGSTSLLPAIERVRPKLVTFGHIHEARGRWTLGGTMFCNASVLNDEYVMNQPATLFLLDEETREVVCSDSVEDLSCAPVPA